MNLKRIIAAGILLMSLAACVEERSNHGETAPGWVAFEYTSALVERCGITAEYLHRFDRYLEQNTSSGRDSVDRLYFSNVKIQRDQEPNSWTLRLKERYGNERTITIRNAVRGGMWEVVGEGLATKFSPRSERAVDHFRVNTGKSGTWYMEHVGRDREFADSSAWTVQFVSDGSLQLVGNGVRTSLAVPALRLDFKTDLPLSYTLRNTSTFTLVDGQLRIIATGPNGLPETTAVTAIGSDRIRINYNNKHSAEGNWNSAIEL